MNPQDAYRQQLRTELARRQVVNPRYSLRAFALTLGFTPSYVSKLLAGQRNLSLEGATQVSEKLGYTPEQAAQFCQLVQMENTPSERTRSLLETAAASPETGYAALSLDGFAVVSDWHHYAILELSTCKGFKNDPKYIARKLGISASEAKAAVDRLVRVGLMKLQQGRLKKTNAFLATPTEQRSQALRNFHDQMIAKARQALHELPLEERDMTSMTLSVSAEALPQVKAEIHKFLMKLAKTFDTNSPNKVVQVNCQLFPLSSVTDKDAT